MLPVARSVSGLGCEDVLLFSGVCFCFPSILAVGAPIHKTPVFIGDRVEVTAFTPGAGDAAVIVGTK